MKKAIVLLSGGLDSLVAVGFPQNKYEIKLALTFDYGQKALQNELYASNEICKYYNIEQKVIKLDWLGEISNSTLVNNPNCISSSSSESVNDLWIPNRNSLFLNIAACYADSLHYDYILYGANKDESNSFPDNTEEFRQSITNVFKTSTLYKPKVIAPLINYTKNDIVKIAIDNSMPLQYVRSCYGSGKKHCGKCESCMYLKNALIKNNGEKYLKILF